MGTGNTAVFCKRVLRARVRCGLSVPAHTPYPLPWVDGVWQVSGPQALEASEFVISRKFRE